MKPFLTDELLGMVKSGWILEKIGENFRQYINAENPRQHKITVVASNPLDPTQTWQVVTGNDDCWRRKVTDAFLLDSVQQVVGRWSADYYGYGGGMRFTNVTIPAGSTIDSAYLKITCRAARAGTTVNSMISGEDVDDAATFSDVTDFDTRYANHTTAVVYWNNIGAWSLDVEYSSPDIKSIIQEIVDRGGWASGNDIVIFWEDFAYQSTGDQSIREGYTYNSSPGKAPKLTITWTEGGILKEVTDSIHLSDSILRDKILTVADSLGLADAILGYKTLTITDLISLVEAILRDETLTVTDSVNLSELVEVITGAIIKYVTDSIGISEQVLINKTLIISDTLSVFDQIFRHKPEISIMDAITLAEVIIASKLFSITDTISLSDVAYALKQLHVSDSISLSEQVSTPTRILEALDTIGLSDNAYVNKTLQITDTVSLAEVVEVGKGGAAKTKLFLIFGDLAIQIQ